MGLDIHSRLFHDDKLPEIEMHVLVDTLKRLSPEQLKTWMELLFKDMQPNAKEAMTQIMWDSLSQREQNMFELPVYGQRVEQESLVARLSNAFARPSVRLQTSEQMDHFDSTRGRDIIGRELARPRRDFEDQIFTVLMEAIMRAERQTNRDQGNQTRREE